MPMTICDNRVQFMFPYLKQSGRRQRTNGQTSRRSWTFTQIGYLGVIFNLTRSVYSFMLKYHRADYIWKKRGGNKQTFSPVGSFSFVHVGICSKKFLFLLQCLNAAVISFCATLIYLCWWGLIAFISNWVDHMKTQIRSVYSCSNHSCFQNLCLDFTEQLAF